MAVTPNSLVTPQATNPGTPCVFTSSNGTTPQTVVGTTSNGCIVRQINVTSTDTAARKVTLSKYNGSTLVTLGVISIAITAGTDAATAAVNLLAAATVAFAKDSNGNSIIQLDSTESLQVVLDANCTAAKVVHVTPTVTDNL